MQKLKKVYVTHSGDSDYEEGDVVFLENIKEIK